MLVRRRRSGRIGPDERGAKLGLARLDLELVELTLEFGQNDFLVDRHDLLAQIVHVAQIRLTPALMHAGEVVRKTLKIVLAGGVDHHRSGGGHVRPAEKDAARAPASRENLAMPHLEENAEVTGHDGRRGAGAVETGRIGRVRAAGERQNAVVPM